MSCNNYDNHQNTFLIVQNQKAFEASANDFIFTDICTHIVLFLQCQEEKVQNICQLIVVQTSLQGVLVHSRSMLTYQLQFLTVRSSAQNDSGNRRRLFPCKTNNAKPKKYSCLYCTANATIAMLRSI